MSIVSSYKWWEKFRKLSGKPRGMLWKYAIIRMLVCSIIIRAPILDEIMNIYYNKNKQ